MTKVIEIARRDRSPSKVVVGEALGSLPAMLPSSSCTIAITDTNLAPLYGDLLNSHFDRVIVIPTGEEIKTMTTVEIVHRRLIELGADRGSYIVGFGGGITTDITGFVASTYLRGVGFGFVATSLLAQVDASVGGKNGVNVGGFKNMAGVFNQPDFVLCDTGVLATLPPREFRAGLAETIKAGIIADGALFETLENLSPEALLANPATLTRAITAAIRVKAAIVEADETEKRERRKLNLGHTVAHAVEKLSREYNHGEAVGIGLVAIADISVRLGLLEPTVRDRIANTVQKAGLPTRVDIPPGKIAQALTRDKKVEDGGLWLAAVRDIGDVTMRLTTFDELSGLLQV